MSSATIVTVNDLLSHREKMSPDYKTLIPRLTDSVALIGHVQKELSFKQRDEIQPYLNQEFKQAFSRTLKPGKFLFGEDLPKTLQVLKVAEHSFLRVLLLMQYLACAQGFQKTNMPSVERSLYLLKTRTIYVVFSL